MSVLLLRGSFETKVQWSKTRFQSFLETFQLKLKTICWSTVRLHLLPNLWPKKNDSVIFWRQRERNRCANVCNTLILQRVCRENYLSPSPSLALCCVLCFSCLIEFILLVKSVVFIDRVCPTVITEISIQFNLFCLHHCIYRSFSELVGKKRDTIRYEIATEGRKSTRKKKNLYFIFVGKKGKEGWRSTQTRCGEKKKGKPIYFSGCIVRQEF